ISAAWQSVVYALVICFTASFFVIAYAEGLARVFNPDPEFVRTAADGFRIAFRLTPLIIFNLVGSGLYQAVGDARKSLLIAVSRMGFFFLPLMLVLPAYMGLPGVWLSFPLGELASALFAAVVTWPKIRELASAERAQEVLTV
ncbi:MAG: MATE family efflux transporter, partial [Spirochaetota bacterium]